MPNLIEIWGNKPNVTFRQKEHIEEAADFTASLIGAVRGMGAQQSTSTWSDKIREEMWVPRLLPPVLGAVVGSDGEVWMKMASKTGGGLWYIFSLETGEVIAEFSLPSDGHPLGAPGRNLWLRGGTPVSPTIEHYIIPI